MHRSRGTVPPGLFGEFLLEESIADLCFSCHSVLPRRYFPSTFSPYHSTSHRMSSSWQQRVNKAHSFDINLCKLKNAQICLNLFTTSKSVRVCTSAGKQKRISFTWKRPTPASRGGREEGWKTFHILILSLFDCVTECDFQPHSEVVTTAVQGKLGIPFKAHRAFQKVRLKMMKQEDPRYYSIRLMGNLCLMGSFRQKQIKYLCYFLLL